MIISQGGKVDMDIDGIGRCQWEKNIYNANLVIKYIDFMQRDFWK